MPRILIADPWCPHFIYSIITQRYNCERKNWNIYFPCVSFLLCELLKWAALWNSQSEQSSTLLFMTLPNKPITDRFILGTNPRVVNAHVKQFLEIFCPYISHIPSMWISENNLKKYCINAFYGTFNDIYIYIYIYKKHFQLIQLQNVTDSIEGFSNSVECH